MPFSARPATRTRSKGDPAIRLTTLKGGHACAHIVINAESGCAVSACAKDGFGMNGTFGAENVVFYAEKGIEIDRNWHHNGLPAGEYTDALLPLDTAILYGETAADNEKSVVLAADFRIPETLPAGKYTGEIVVACDEKISMPYELTVLDSVQPQEITCKSLFTVNPNYMEHYEESRSQETMDSYIRALLDCRIMPTSLLAAEDYSEKGLREFARSAAKWARCGVSTIGLPTFVKKESDGEYPDFDVFRRAIFALIEESLTSEINLLSYAALYDWQIDEPFLVKMPDGKVERCVNEFCDTIDEIVKILQQDRRLDTSFGQEIVCAVKNIPHVITDYCDRLPEVLHYVDVRQKKDANGELYRYPMDKVTLCPKFDGYDSAFLSAPYDENLQKWWYGCNAPSAPYVSYHMDDAPWSARYIGWLMVRFGIVGNLYWVVNQGIEINTTGKPLYLDDPYGTAHRGFGANGDGVLLYPGKPYGLKHPIGSTRLMEIRDGNADYEWLKILREGYKSKGTSFDSLFDRMTAPFACGVRIDTFADGFDQAAESFIRLYDAWNHCGLAVECEDDKDTVTFRFTADERAKLWLDENPVFGEAKVRYGERYAVLRVESGDYTTEIPLWVGGRLTVFLHEELYRSGAVTSDTATIEPLRHDIYRELTITPQTSKTTVRVTLPETVCKCKHRAGIELRAYRGAAITLIADGRNIVTHIKDEWSRLDFSLQNNHFSITFEGDKSVALGAVYLH